MIHNGLSGLHPGTLRQEHPLPWWHLCCATAMQCQAKPVATLSAGFLFPVSPGVLLLKGKGKWGEHGTHRCAKSWQSSGASTLEHCSR